MLLHMLFLWFTCSKPSHVGNSPIRTDTLGHFKSRDDVSVGVSVSVSVSVGVDDPWC